ncbi:MAG: Rho termination factor N-terminal domain-containing protein, partial [Bacteroidales bacterium]|nr:Rho termination factor N-terminal domain-containing protein [Bacteroidales bacterium]
MYDILELSKMLLPELREIAKELKIKRAETLKKQDLVYKILDQQALEATESKAAARSENNGTPLSNGIINQGPGSGLRRGKRPRTSKPVLNRPAESVMSVSPDDLKKPEDREEESAEPARTQEKSEDKPPLFKEKADEPQTGETKPPFWKNDIPADKPAEVIMKSDRDKSEIPEDIIPDP